MKYSHLCLELLIYLYLIQVIMSDDKTVTENKFKKISSAQKEIPNDISSIPE
jgi:hypothetical protein